MTIQKWVEENRVMIDDYYRSYNGTNAENDEEREDFVMNVESLYLEAIANGVVME